MSKSDLVIGGLHATRIALENAGDDALEVWVRRGAASEALDALAALARQHGVTVQVADDGTLDKLTGDSHHQGVALRRRAPRPLDAEGLLALVALTDSPLLLVLDNVQDPRNFGACLRIADGAGVAAVVHTRDRSARLTSVVAKAASGAVDTVPLAAVTNLARTMLQLRDAGVWLTGAAHDAGTTLYDADLRGAAGLVLGNEATGLRRLTRERCDTLVGIPMRGALDSLNVSAAAAVCLFEARRQRDAAA